MSVESTKVIQRWIKVELTSNEWIISEMKMKIKCWINVSYPTLNQGWQINVEWILKNKCWINVSYPTLIQSWQINVEGILKNNC